MLVGFATILLPDTMYQLFLAFMFCLLHMLFTAICQPYRAIGNEYFALCCNFSLTVFFFFSIFLKVDTVTLTLTLTTGPYPDHCPSPSSPSPNPTFPKYNDLTEAVTGVMTDSLKNRFAMEADVLSLGLMVVVISSIVLVFVLTVQQVYAAADEPTLTLTLTLTPTPTPTSAPNPTLAPTPTPTTHPGLRRGQRADLPRGGDQGPAGDKPQQGAEVAPLPIAHLGHRPGPVRQHQAAGALALTLTLTQALALMRTLTRT